MMVDAAASRMISGTMNHQRPGSRKGIGERLSGCKSLTNRWEKCWDLGCSVKEEIPESPDIFEEYRCQHPLSVEGSAVKRTHEKIATSVLWESQKSIKTCFLRSMRNVDFEVSLWGWMIRNKMGSFTMRIDVEEVGSLGTQTRRIETFHSTDNATHGRKSRKRNGPTLHGRLLDFRGRGAGSWISQTVWTIENL